MTIKHQNLDHHLVIQCQEITNHFESQIADLVMAARGLSFGDRDKIANELKATIHNINFIFNSLSSLQDEEN